MKDGSVFTIKGEKPGKTLTIMAGVHGREVCGVMALRNILDAIGKKEVIIKAGTVHFIFANLAAISRGVREIDMNLNRAFRPLEQLTEEEKNSYERGRAEQLMPFLAESDALLDIHSSTNKESTPFIICEPHSYPIARMLAFPIRSHGWDVIEAGGTDYYVNLNGGQGICIECGSHDDILAPQRALESIKIFLMLMGAIETTQEIIPTAGQRVLDANYIYKTAVNFAYLGEYADFAPVSRGELLGYDGGAEVRVPKDSLIIFPTMRKEAGKEAFILAEEEPSNDAA